MKKWAYFSNKIVIIAICIIMTALLFGCASKEAGTGKTESKVTLPDMSYITDDGTVVEGRIIKLQTNMPDSIIDEYGRGEVRLIVDNSRQFKKVFLNLMEESFRKLCERYDESFFETHNLAISLLSGNLNEEITYLSSIEFDNVVEQRYGYHDVAASGGLVEAMYVEYLFISEVTKNIDTVVLHEERYVAEVK